MAKDDKLKALDAAIAQIERQYGKRLCEKLGIGIAAESSEQGTAISLAFHINCLIHEVQG